MATRLKRLREAVGLTQQDLAEQAEVSLSAVRQWERGDRTPNLEVACRLADALDVSLDELAGRRWRRRRRRR